MMIRRNRKLFSDKENKLEETNKKEEPTTKVKLEELSWNELRKYISDNNLDVGGNTKKADILNYLNKEG